MPPVTARRDDRCQRPRRKSNDRHPELAAWCDQHDGETTQPDRHRREVHERGHEPNGDRVAGDPVATRGNDAQHTEPKRCHHGEATTYGEP